LVYCQLPGFRRFHSKAKKKMKKIAMFPATIKSANTILYCGKWDETVRFYRDLLGLTVVFAADWFVEFRLCAGSLLSVADERRTSVKSCRGRGVTITMEVDDIETACRTAREKGLGPTEISLHPWNAKVFYLLDPEGHRLEIWQRAPGPDSNKDRDVTTFI
jgi:catechol 2,3-dioxygenase-like lactoylglutathione lyase family enzyme